MRESGRVTQTAFGRLVGMRQPHVARLEAGEHEPSLSTLVRLSAALGVDFTVDINPPGHSCARAPESGPHFLYRPVT